MASTNVVAAILGHASAATTLRLYAHVTHASTEAERLVDIDRGNR
jgi:integrase